MLFLLAVITHKDYCCDITLEERLWPITKDHTFILMNEIEMMRDDLEQKRKELEKEKEAIEMEKRVVAAEKEEVAVKCKAFEIAMKKLTPDDIASIVRSLKDLDLKWKPQYIQECNYICVKRYILEL